MIVSTEQSCMPEAPTRLSDEALADIAYLGRSGNRVKILETIVSHPHSPREIAEATGSARSTLERILTELEDRGWAKRTPDGTYEATDTGEFVIDEFVPALDAMEAIRNLGDTISWLPRDELSISLAHFRDATIRRREVDDPTEGVDQMAELMGNTENFRVISNLIPPDPIATVLHDQVDAGRLTVDYVLTEGVLDYLRSRPERRERWVDTMGTDADLWIWEGDVPCNLWIFDDTVWIKNDSPIQDAYGVPIITDDDTVRSWAHDLIDRYRDEATPVDIATFAGELPADRPDSDSGH